MTESYNKKHRKTGKGLFVLIKPSAGSRKMKLIKDLREFVGEGGFIKTVGTVLINPCFHSVVLYRLSAFFYKIKCSVLAKFIWYINRVIFSVDIDYRANLAGGFVLVHGLGTVIGKDVVSLGPLVVYQGVTIGGSGKSRIIEGEKEIWQPILGKNVCIYTNAMVLGPVRISDNVKIKAGERITIDC